MDLIRLNPRQFSCLLFILYLYDDVCKNNKYLPIKLIEPNELRETLGVWTNCLNDPFKGLEVIKKTGLNWVDCLKCHLLDKRDVLLILSANNTPSGHTAYHHFTPPPPLLTRFPAPSTSTPSPSWASTTTLPLPIPYPSPRIPRHWSPSLVHRETQ